jgi:hypothetical protein
MGLMGLNSGTPTHLQDHSDSRFKVKPPCFKVYSRRKEFQAAAAQMTDIERTDNVTKPATRLLAAPPPPPITKRKKRKTLPNDFNPRRSRRVANLQLKSAGSWDFVMIRSIFPSKTPKSMFTFLMQHFPESILLPWQPYLAGNCLLKAGPKPDWRGCRSCFFSVPCYNAACFSYLECKGPE